MLLPPCGPCLKRDPGRAWPFLRPPVSVVPTSCLLSARSDLLARLVPAFSVAVAALADTGSLQRRPRVQAVPVRVVAQGCSLPCEGPWPPGSCLRDASAHPLGTCSKCRGSDAALPDPSAGVSVHSKSEKGWPGRAWSPGPALSGRACGCPWRDCDATGGCMAIWALRKSHTFWKLPSLGNKEHWFALNFELLGFPVMIICQCHW